MSTTDGTDAGHAPLPGLAGEELTLDTVRGIRVYRRGSKVYPSVSAVLDLLFPSKGEWIDQKYLDEGTRCHEDMAAAVKWRMASESQAWPAVANPRVAALIEYLSKHDMVPFEAEVPHCNEAYGYAGKPDAAFHCPGGILVPDWKFSQSLDLRYRFQLQAYMRFYTDANKARLMLFRVNRECKVIPTPVPISAAQWTLFLNALACLKFRCQ